MTNMTLLDIYKEGMAEFDEKFGTIKHRGFPQTAIKSHITSLTLRLLEAEVAELADILEQLHGGGNARRLLLSTITSRQDLLAKIKGE